MNIISLNGLSIWVTHSFRVSGTDCALFFRKIKITEKWIQVTL